MHCLGWLSLAQCCTDLFYIFLTLIFFQKYDSPNQQIYIYKPEDPISPRQLFVQPHGSGNLCQLWIVLAVSLGVGYVLMCKASSLIVPGDDNTPWLFWRHCRKTVLSAASGLGCDQDFLIPLHSGQEHTCTGYNNKWGFIASIWYFSQCHQSAAAIH